MTKAKARKRAKARAAAKGGRPGAKGGKPEVKIRPGQFDAESDSVLKIGSGADIKNLSMMKRGAARSR